MLSLKKRHWKFDLKVETGMTMAVTSGSKPKQFLVILFQLCNALSAFNHRIQIVHDKISWKRVLEYLDHPKHDRGIQKPACR